MRLNSLYRSMFRVKAFPDGDETYFHSRGPEVDADWGYERIRNPLRLSAAMYASATQSRGPRSPASAYITLENADAALDGFVDQDWANKTLQVTSTNGTPAFNGYSIEATGSSDQLEIYGSCALSGFNKTAMPERYLGTNVLPAGIEGTTDIKGKVKPRVLGTYFNFTPILVNTSKYIYQVDGQIGFLTGWSLTVYDGRVALTQGADYADQAAMELTAPAAGTFRVCPSLGCFRVNAKAVYSYTCDGINPVTAFPGVPGGTSGQISMIAHLSAEAATSYVVFPESVMSGVPSQADPVCGVAYSADVTYEHILNELVSSSGSAMCPTSTGHLAVRRWPGRDLAADLTIRVIDDKVILKDGSNRSMLALLRASDSDKGVRPWKVNVRYKRNYTVMSAEQVAGVADESLVKDEWQVVSAENALILADNPSAPEVTFDTQISSQANAQTLATFWLGVLGAQKHFYKVPIPTRGSLISSLQPSFNVYLGTNFTLSASRYGLSAGKDVMVTGIDLDSNSGVMTLTCWG